MKKNVENTDIPKDSRSVRRTKMALKNKLIELMKAKSILRISVKEICDSADVGRSTFYAHYESQYGLLEEIVMESMSVFEKELGMNQPLRKESNRDLAEKIEKTLVFIANNKDSVQILFSENGDIYIQRKLIFSLNNYLKNSKKLYTDNSVDEKTSECYSVFFVHGAIALVQHWLKNNMNIPVPELAKIILSLARELRQ